MCKFARFNLVVLILSALAVSAEASVQTKPLEPRPLCPALDSSVETGMVSTENADFGSYTAFCSLEMPRLVIDACVGCAQLGSQGSALCNLADIAVLHRQALPEPSTIAVWSLIGLCWSGVSCWRRRHGLGQNRVGWDRLRPQRSMTRPPWPEDVRTRILEIIEKGAHR
jgi:hypothetical protein